MGGKGEEGEGKRFEERELALVGEQELVSKDITGANDCWRLGGLLRKPKWG